MKDKLKYYWEEYVKSAMLFILVGALMVVGIRLMETIWEKPRTKVLICIASDLGKIDACSVFKNSKKLPIPKQQ